MASTHDAMSSTSRTSLSERTRTLTPRSPRSAPVGAASTAARGPRERARAAPRCSGRRRPRSPPGTSRSQASASAASDTPRPAASRSSSSSASNVASVRKRSLPSGRSVIREPDGGWLPAAVLPGQPATGERAVRRVAEAVLVAEGEDRLAVVLHEQREGVLHPLVAREPLERGELERLGELIRREVRRADRTDEALADELVEAPEASPPAGRRDRSRGRGRAARARDRAGAGSTRAAGGSARRRGRGRRPPSSG